MPDAFGRLLDGLAEEIARRVLVRLDAELASRSASVTPEAYRLAQAAEALSLSEREVRRLIASGQLASKRVGRAVLVPREAIAEFLAASNESPR
jgi:excisionase family DNA binding protein